MCVPACPEQAKCVGAVGFVSVNEGMNLCCVFLLVALYH